MAEYEFPVCTLDGVPLLAGGPISWSLTTGVEPVVVDLPVRPVDLPALLAGAKPLGSTLTIGPLTIEKLSILSTAQAENPYRAKVTVADRRWLWPRVVVNKGFNHRRRVGAVRRDAAWLRTSELETAAVDEVVYRAYSCKDGISEPWTPLEILEAVLKIVDPTAAFSSPSPLSIPVENLLLTHPGDAAISAVLSKMPSLAVTVSPAGVVDFFSVTDGAEAKLVGAGDPSAPGAAGSEMVGGGHISPVDRSAQIPSSFKVLFTPEIELRVDALDIPGVTEGSTTTEPKRHLVNVCRVPDFELDVSTTDSSGVAKTVKVAAGTYLPISTLFSTWSDAAPTSLQGKLSDKLMRRAMVPGRTGRLFSTFSSAALKLDDTKTAVWHTRLSAAFNAYRQVYQLDRGWLDRILELRPYLVGTVDPVSGQRAPALVYSNYCTKTSTLGLFRGPDHPAEGLPWANNITGYPGVDTDPTATSRPAPCHVVIEDQDQGIIRLVYTPEPYGGVEKVVPSVIVTGTMPRHKLAKSSTTPITFGSITSKEVVPELSADSRQAIWLTAVPVNSMYEVTVTALELSLQGKTPAVMKDALATAKGPPVELICPPAIETARIPWSQDAVTDIEAAFGIASGSGVSVTGRVRIERDKLRAMNDTPASELGTKAASLPAIARAIATSWVSNIIGLVEGSMTGGMLPSARCLGRVASVTHTVAPNGALTTNYQLMPALPQFDMLSYLDTATRRVVMGTVV